MHLDPQAEATEFQAEFHLAVKRVMVQMMLADGRVDDDEVKTIREIYRQLTNTEISDDDVRSLVGQMERERQDITTSLAQCAGYLNDDGKAMVVKAAFLVAAADGEFQDEEKALLATIGQSLDMSVAHLNGVISSMLNE